MFAADPSRSVPSVGDKERISHCALTMYLQKGHANTKTLIADYVGDLQGSASALEPVAFLVWVTIQNRVAATHIPNRATGHLTTPGVLQSMPQGLAVNTCGDRISKSSLRSHHFKDCG